MKRPAIVTALPGERRTLDALGDVAAVVAGIGQHNAARGAAMLLEGSVDGLLSWGTSGGLDPDVPPGTLIVGTSVHGADGRELPCDPGWCARLHERLPGSWIGAVYSSASATATVRAKQAIHRATGSVSVDMESAALAELAQHHGLPFAVVRAVVDPAEFDLPDAVLNSVYQDDGPCLGPLLATLLRQPGEILAVLRLARWYRAALGALRLAAHRLGPDFALNERQPAVAAARDAAVANR